MARHTLFILVATTGAGKTTLSELITERFRAIKRIRSCTTRTRRHGEPVDAYHWLSRQDFESQVRAGHFVEHDEFGGNLYGRRFSDFDQLEHGPCFADMTESGIAALQERPEFRTVCIRITAVNKKALAREVERSKDDEARTRIPIQVMHEVRNDHGKEDGLERAYEEIRDIIYMHIFPEG